MKQRSSVTRMTVWRGNEERRKGDAPQLADVGAEHAEERRNEGDVCVIRGDDTRPLDDRRRDMST